MGTKQSFEDFVKAHAGAVLALSTMLTDTRTEAEDLAQEALLKAFKSWARLQRADSSSAYLRKMVMNEFLSQKRRRTLRVVPLSDHDQPDLPSNAVAQSELSLALRPLIAALPPQQRAAIVLRFYAQLSTEEIGSELGVAESTVRSTIARALASLRTGWTRSTIEDMT